MLRHPRRTHVPVGGTPTRAAEAGELPTDRSSSIWRILIVEALGK